MLNIYASKHLKFEQINIQILFTILFRDSFLSVQKKNIETIYCFRRQKYEQTNILLLVPSRQSLRFFLELGQERTLANFL